MEILDVVPQDVFKIFGSYVDNEKSMVNWNTILRIMQEEANQKEVQRNARIYGHKKIFLQKGKRINLTNPKLGQFSHQYAINYIHHVNFLKQSIVLVILNHNTLVVFDEEMHEVKYKANFYRDYISFHANQLLIKDMIQEQEKKKEENTKNCLDADKLFANLYKRMTGKKKKKKQAKKHDVIEPNKNTIDIELWSGIKKDTKVNPVGYGNNMNKPHGVTKQNGTNTTSSSESNGSQSYDENLSSEENLFHDNMRKSAIMNRHKMECEVAHDNFRDGSPEGKKKRCSRRTSKMNSKRDIRMGSNSNVGSRTDIAIDKNQRHTKDKINNFRDSQRSVNKNTGRENQVHKRNYSQGGGYLVDSHTIDVKTSKVEKRITSNRNSSIERDSKTGQLSFSKNRNIEVSKDQFDIQVENINFNNPLENSNPDALSKCMKLSDQIKNKMNTISRIGTDIDRGQNAMPKIGTFNKVNTSVKPDDEKPTVINDYQSAKNNDLFLLKRGSRVMNSSKDKLLGDHSKLSDKKLLESFQYNSEVATKLNNSLDISTNIHSKVHDISMQKKGNTTATAAFNDIFESKVTEPKNKRITSGFRESHMSRALINQSVDHDNRMSHNKNVMPPVISNKSSQRRINVSSGGIGLPFSFLGKSNVDDNKSSFGSKQFTGRGDNNSKMGQTGESALKQMNEQANVGDLANNKIIKKYDKRKNNTFEVEEKDREKITKLFDAFKVRTCQKNILISNALKDLANDYQSEGDLKKDLDILKDFRNPNGKPIDFSDEKNLEEAISKMLFNNRLNVFKTKTEKFHQKADVMRTKLRTIGATITKGKESEEDKSLYEDLMRKFIINQILKKKTHGNLPKKKQRFLSNKLSKKLEEQNGCLCDNGLQTEEKAHYDNGMKLSCIAYHYWHEMNYLILGFLSREVWIYKVDQDFKLEFRFMEELRLKGYPNNIFVTKSVFHDCYFMILVMNFNFLKIYRFQIDKGDLKSFKLLPNLEKESNCLYSAEFNMLTFVKNFRDYTVLCDIRNNVFVIKQVAPEKFQMIKKINIQEKSTSFTLTAVEISVRHSLIFMGSSQGYMYIYDIDLKNIIHKSRVHVDKIIEIIFVNCFNNLYVISSRKKIKVLDLQSYEEIQELDLTDVNRFSNVSFGFISNIDMLYNNFRNSLIKEAEIENLNKTKSSTITQKPPSKGSFLLNSKDSLVDKFGQKNQNDDELINITETLTSVDKRKRILNTQEYFNEDELIKEQKYDDMAMKQLVEKINTGGLKIYIGHSEIFELIFTLKKREGFKEEVYHYNLLHIDDKSLKMGNDEDRSDFYNKVFSEDSVWEYVAYNSKSDQPNIALLNRRKFLIIFDTVTNEITKFCMVNLYGKVLKMEYTINNSLLQANSRGECIVLNVEIMQTKHKFHLPLTHVLSVEAIWNESYLLAFINSPNEIFVVKNLQKKAEFVYDSLNHKEIEHVKVRDHICHVASNSTIILLVTEEMNFIAIKKKTMKLIREFRFSQLIPETLKHVQNNSEVFEHITKSILLKEVMYIQFDDGTILKCDFDANFTTRLEVATIYRERNIKFAPNIGSNSVYIVNKDLRYKKLLPKNGNDDQDFAKAIQDFQDYNNDEIMISELSRSKPPHRQSFNDAGDHFVNNGTNLVEQNSKKHLENSKNIDFSPEHSNSGRKSSIKSPLKKAIKFENDKISVHSNIKRDRKDTNNSIQNCPTHENEDFQSHSKSNYQKHTAEKERNSVERNSNVIKSTSKNLFLKNDANLVSAFDKKTKPVTRKTDNEFYREAKISELKEVDLGFDCAHIIHFKGMKTVALVGNNCQLMLVDTEGYYKESINLFKKFVENNVRLQGYDYVTNNYETKQEIKMPISIKTNDKVKSSGRNMLREF